MRGLEKSGGATSRAKRTHRKRPVSRHDLAQDAVPREERGDDELREETRLHALDQPPRPASLPGLAELDRPHEAEPPDGLDDVELVDERRRELHEPLAEPRGVLDELLL